jgi:hypothetical protein
LVRLSSISDDVYGEFSSVSGFTFKWVPTAIHTSSDAMLSPPYSTLLHEKLQIAEAAKDFHFIFGNHSQKEN